MQDDEIFDLIKDMFRAHIKGQISIDFSGDGKKAHVRFTNIAAHDLKKLKLSLHEKSDIN